nr:WAT1-related protein At2g39510-like [Ipomoea batatas]
MSTGSVTEDDKENWSKMLTTIVVIDHIKMKHVMSLENFQDDRGQNHKMLLSFARGLDESFQSLNSSTEVQRRVIALREIQNKHDEFEVEYSKEKAALDAKVFGAGVIVIGLYMVLWGKKQDQDSQESLNDQVASIDKPPSTLVKFPTKQEPIDTPRAIAGDEAV